MAESSSSAATPAAAQAAADGGLRRRKPEEPAAAASSSASEANNGNATATASAGSKKSKPHGPSSADRAAVVDYHFKLSSIVTLVWFVVLTALMYVICPSERIERLEGIERTAAILAAATLVVSCLSTVHRSFSGVIAAALVVQLCAVATDVLMAVAPVPVMIDGVTGARVHMLRWCEFAPLAFLMTLLTEGGDMANDPDTGVRQAYILALLQGASTTFGLIFPFAPGVKSWIFCLCCALALFLPIFFRLAAKKAKVRSMNPKGRTYRRSVLCLRLLIVEVVVWTMLVVGFLCANVLPALLSSFPKLKNPAVTMVYDCAMDVIAKVIYMALIVNVHDAMFSQAGSVGGSGVGGTSSRNLGRGQGEQPTLEEIKMKEARRQLRKQKRAEKERREARKAEKKAAAAAVAAAGGAGGEAAPATSQTRKEQ